MKVIEFITTFSVQGRDGIEHKSIDDLYLLTPPEKFHRTVLLLVEDAWYLTQVPGDYNANQTLSKVKSLFHTLTPLTETVEVTMERLSIDYVGECKTVDKDRRIVTTVRQVHHIEHWSRVDGALLQLTCGLRYRGSVYPSGGEWDYKGNWINLDPVSVLEPDMRHKAAVHFAQPELYVFARQYFEMETVTC